MMSKAILTGKAWEEAKAAWLRNGWWYGYESIILAMVKDEDIKTRRAAAEEIQQAWKRGQGHTRKTVRKFEFFPKLFDSEASDYTKMIPFEKLSPRQKTVPPLILGLIKDLGIKEVVRLTINGNLPVLEVPCHSQGQSKSPASFENWYILFQN